jgi:outer membrane immunogenic protein
MLWGVAMRRITTVLAASIALCLSMSQATFAGGIPVKAVAPPPPPPITWNGIYFGLHWGGGWGEKDWFYPLFATATSHQVMGPLAGVQAGFNWQAGNWVFGVEGQWSWSDLDGGSVCPNPAFSCNTQVDWLGSVAARLGIAGPKWLIFLKGGWAFARENHTATVITAPVLNEETGDIDRDGWMLGLGAEYALTPAWSAKFEVD